MDTVARFAIPEQLHVGALVFEHGGVTVLTSTASPTAPCPACGRSSRRVHRRYTRTIADLPWGGVPIRLRVRARKCFCDDRRCGHKVFAERLDGVAQAYARRTDRQREALDLIAFALGGEAGARLAAELGLRVSPDSLLAYVRRSPEVGHPAPRVVGVDDWAVRKAQVYGTILVDLGRHRVVDLLPDRTADTVAAWFKEHPGAEFVARDGSSAYADGVSRGSPGAVQVADRFHLVANLREVLRQLLERNRERLPASPDAPQAVAEGGSRHPPRGTAS